MTQQFDPYHAWLGIRPEEQPVDHYRLLGLARFENEPAVVQSALDRQMAHIKTFARGPHGPLSQQMLNELSQAGLTLLSESRRAAYDAELRARLQPAAASLAPAEAAPTPKTDDSGSDRETEVAPSAEADDEANARLRPKREGSIVGLAAMLLLGAVAGIGGGLWVVQQILGDKAPTLQKLVAGGGGGEPGVLVFDWPLEERADVQLRIDGKPRTFPERGPLRVELPPGPHAWTAQRTGFQERRETAAMARGTAVAAPWTWKPAAVLELEWPESERVGGVAEVDGRPAFVMESTPEKQRLAVEPGERKLVVRRAGAGAFQQTVTVEPLQQAVVRPRFAVPESFSVAAAFPDSPSHGPVDAAKASPAETPTTPSQAPTAPLEAQTSPAESVPERIEPTSPQPDKAPPVRSLADLVPPAAAPSPGPPAAGVAAPASSPSSPSGAAAVPAVVNGLKAVYFARKNFTEPRLQRIDPTVDFAWGWGPPSPSIPANFSVRWEGWIKAPRGQYRFIAVHDDSVRMWLDDAMVLDGAGGWPKRTAVGVALTGKPQKVKIDYVDGDLNATMLLRWVRPGVFEERTVPSWAYFPTREAAEEAKLVDVPDEPLVGGRGDVGLTADYFSGEFKKPLFRRIDRVIDHWWCREALGPGLPHDHFSVRWTGFILAPEPGEYLLAACADNRIRVKIGNDVVIDNWSTEVFVRSVAKVQFERTSLPIVVEFHEAGSEAGATLRWTPPGGREEVVPPSAFSQKLRRVAPPKSAPDPSAKVAAVPSPSQPEPKPAAPPEPKPVASPAPDYAEFATGRWIPLLNTAAEFDRLVARRSFAESTKKDVVVPQLRFEGGVLECRGGGLLFPAIRARDAIIRAQVKKLAGQHVGFRLRDHDGDFSALCFNGGGFFCIGRARSGWKDLKVRNLSERYDDYFELAFAAVGRKLTVYANGRRILETEDDLPAGSEAPFGVPGVVSSWTGGTLGAGLYKDVEVQILDAEPSPAPQSPRGDPISNAAPNAPSPPKGPGAGSPDLALPAAARPVPTQRMLVPGEVERIKAAELVREAFKTEYERLDQPTGPGNLVRRLLAAAAEEKDSAARYALLEEARAIAARGQEPALAIEAVGELEQSFEVDGTALRRKTLREASLEVKSSAVRAKLLRAADESASAAAAVEEFSAAADCVDVALAALEGTGSPSVLKRYQEQRALFLESAELAARAAAARDVLATTPDDPTANLAVGRHRCEVREDFAGGMPFLAKGPAPWNAAAVLDSPADAPSPENRLAAAEAWQAIGESLSGRARLVWLGRAAVRCAEAVPGLSGLAKVRAESLSKTLVETVPEEYRKP